MHAHSPSDKARAARTLMAEVMRWAARSCTYCSLLSSVTSISEPLGTSSTCSVDRPPHPRHTSACIAIFGRAPKHRTNGRRTVLCTPNSSTSAANVRSSPMSSSEYCRICFSDL